MEVGIDDYREEAGLRAAVQAILSEATDLGIDRRRLDRKPYLKKVLIQRSENSVPLTAFTREVCNNGVGLLHAFRLKPNDDIVVVIMGPDRAMYQLQVDVSWCEPLGDGWYVSGCEFVARLDS